MKGSHTVKWYMENSPGIVRENRSFLRGGPIKAVSKSHPHIDLLKQLMVLYAKPPAWAS